MGVGGEMKKRMIAKIGFPKNMYSYFVGWWYAFWVETRNRARYVSCGLGSMCVGRNLL